MTNAIVSRNELLLHTFLEDAMTEALATLFKVIRFYFHFIYSSDTSYLPHLAPETISIMN